MPYKDPEKQKEASRRWYLKNRETHMRRVMERSAALRKEVYDYKEMNPCQDCGKKYPHPVMEFDHVRGEKVSNVGDILNRNHSRAQMWTEIDKCDLVCANCHRLRTHSRMKAKKKKKGAKK